MKSLGKKAIGFIKGMNGNKIASTIVGALDSIYPGATAIFSGAIPATGKLINDSLNYLDDSIKLDVDQERRPGGIYRRRR